MNQDELDRLLKMYDRMTDVCIQTLETVQALSEANTTKFGKLEYISKAPFQLQINNLKVYLKNYVKALRPVPKIETKDE